MFYLQKQFMMKFKALLTTWLPSGFVQGGVTTGLEPRHNVLVWIEECHWRGIYAKENQYTASYNATTKIIQY